MSELTQSQREILAMFSSGADRLEAAVQGLSDQELDYVDAPGGWTIRQMVHHVADDGDAWSMPFKKALATPGAPIRLEGFPGNDAWAEALDFAGRPIHTAVALVRTHNQQMRDLAEHFPESWDRFVTILDSQGNEVQQVSAGQIIAMLSEHLLEHVAAIEGLRRRLGR